MNKPLSETHPTLYNKSVLFGGDLVGTQFVQKYTVDVAEHERLKAEVEHLQERLDGIIEADFFCEDCGQNVVSSEHKRGINCADCEPANSGLRAEIERLKKELERWSKGHPHTDDCPDMECSECGKRDCPYQDADHYHHDGCPSCWSKERAHYDAGVIEGERRAMERAANLFADIFDEFVDTKRHKIFLERLGLGEESTDNNNYTNNTEVNK